MTNIIANARKMFGADLRLYLILLVTMVVTMAWLGLKLVGLGIATPLSFVFYSITAIIFYTVVAIAVSNNEKTDIDIYRLLY